MKTFKSDLSHLEFPFSERVSASSIRPSVMQLIQKDKADFGKESYLSMSELSIYREKIISEYLNTQLGELTSLEKSVIEVMGDKKTISETLDGEGHQHMTFGQKLADKVATFGGSWTFITSFGLFLLIWIIFNFFWLANKGFDPYPFILLNLILSCIAAIQAPIIMMSQNRQEEKDRERARNDYMVNLKSELEIRSLHEKIDHLMIHQQAELLEIQKVQMEMMDDILKKLEK